MNGIYTPVLKISRIIFVMLLMFASYSAFCADVTGDINNTTESINTASQIVEPVSSGYLVQLVSGLMFVLLCIIALAWLARRVNRLQSSSDGNLKVLGGMSMGARERVVLVQVGVEQVLLGVAPGRVNMLHVLNQPLENTLSQMGGDENAKPVKPRFVDLSFAEKLNDALKKGRS